MWGDGWRGKTVQCWCDNAAVVANIKSGTSKHSLVMHLMRCLFSSVPLQLSLTSSRRGVPPPTCSSPSRMAAYSPGNASSTSSGMPCRRRVSRARSIAVIVYASVQPLRQRLEEWRIVSSRRWAGGRAWPIRDMCAFRGSSWQVTLPCWLREAAHSCLHTPSNPPCV